MPESLAALLEQLPSNEAVISLAADFGAKLLRFLIVIGLGAIAARVVGGVVAAALRRLASPSGKNADPLWLSERHKRTETLANVTRRTVSVAVWVIVGIMALSEVGFDVGPLLAGAGVVGVALGFGAQNLVRDILAGCFILFEDQIRVGDVAVLNDTGGLVEQINLRTTVLRDLEGVVHVFPNGLIEKIANRTRDYSCHVFDFGVAYKEDADRVASIIREIVAQMREDETVSKQILDDVEVFGLDAFADSAIIIKGRIKTVAGSQWAVRREFNRRMKIRLDAEGIEIPFPHRTLFLRQDQERTFEQVAHEAFESGASRRPPNRIEGAE